MYKLSIFYKKGVKLYRPTEKEVKRRWKEYEKMVLEEVTTGLIEAKKRRDGKYNIDGDVNLQNRNINSLLKFHVKFGKIIGNFDCSFNELKDLKGAPEYVSGDFICIYNQLKSLEGAPAYVGGDFYGWNNAKKFTEEEVRKVVEVKGNVYV